MSGSVHQDRPAAVTLRELLDLLALEAGQTDATGDYFVGRPQPHPEDRVFGGLQLAQAVAAAGRTVPENHRALSLQADFLAGVPTGGPLRWRVERLSDARSLSTRRTSLVADDGKELFTAVSRWGTAREDMPVHHPARPLPAPAPEGLPELADRFGDDERVPPWWRMERPVTFRHTMPPPYLEVVEPRQDHQTAWVRTTAPLPDDEVGKAAVVAYITDMSILEGAFRALGSRRHAEGSRILSLTHTLAWHRHPDLSDWHQFDSRIQAVSHGRTLGTGEIFDREGRHVVSASQLGLVRLA
jgi:acyl-CoA thioesterase-2